jgi:ribosomal protein S18 acetylase RimI-like enzyme
MRGGVLVRQARAADAEAIARMAADFADELAALPVAAGTPEIPEGDDAALTPAVLLRDVFSAAPRAHVLLADAEGLAVGYLMYHFGYWPADAAPSLHVVDLYVDSAARGQGAGRALMDAAADALREQGGRRLIWTVWDQNHAAMAFYEKLGARFFTEERLMTVRIG